MDRQRLAQAVIDRRVALGYRTRESFATDTGLSSRLLGDVERADRDNYDPVTLTRLDKALRWSSGTARALLTARPDEPEQPGEPTEEKLHRLAVFLPLLNRRDHAWLRETLDNLLEWADSHAGRPERTPEEQAQIDQLQATFAEHNRRQRERGAQGSPEESRTAR